MRKPAPRARLHWLCAVSLLANAGAVGYAPHHWPLVLIGFLAGVLGTLGLILTLCRR